MQLKNLSVSDHEPIRAVADSVKTMTTSPYTCDRDQHGEDCVAEQILHILRSYSQHETLGSMASELKVQRAHFLPKIKFWMGQKRPIAMVLPAFPFKSVGFHDTFSVSTI